MDIAKELREQKDSMDVWQLAGDGWQTYLRHRLTRVRQQRNRQWSNADSAKVDAFFAEVLGITKVTEAWHWWPAISVPVAKRKLDDIVTLRGDIAHRGKTLRYVKKQRVVSALSHVRKLVKVTDAKVTADLETITGVAPWTQPAR
jgi:hypothetical protein